MDDVTRMQEAFEEYETRVKTEGESVSVSRIAKKKDVDRYKLFYKIKLAKKKKERTTFGISKINKKKLMEEISDKYLKEGPVTKTWIFNRAKQLSFNNKQPSETWFATNIRQNIRFKNMISSPLNNKKSEMIFSKPN